MPTTGGGGNTSGNGSQKEQKRGDDGVLRIRYKTPKGTWGKWTVVKGKKPSMPEREPRVKEKRTSVSPDYPVSIPTPISKIPTPVPPDKKKGMVVNRKKRGA